MKWSWRSNPKRFVVVLLVAVLVGATMGWVGGTLVNRADGSTRVLHRDELNVPAVDIRPRHKRSASRFREGRIHHSSGFRPSRVFRSPRVARGIFVTKIERALARHRTARLTAGVCEHPGNDRLCAYEIYGHLQEKASCADRGPAYPTAEGTCWFPQTRPFTKQEIQTGGAVFFCGGTVIIGVATSGATAGTTAFIAMWGAASCGWAFWDAID
jgi:hypothetical protein